jgi:hypothetical protein
VLVITTASARLKPSADLVDDRCWWELQHERGERRFSATATIVPSHLLNLLVVTAVDIPACEFIQHFP